MNILFRFLHKLQRNQSKVIGDKLEARLFMEKQLDEKLKIAVIGLGYVGLPLSINLAKYFAVVGFDTNLDRVKELRQGFDRTQEIISIDLQSTSMTFTIAEEEIKGCDVFIITVPTPVDQDNKPDLTAVLDASSLVGKVIQKGAIVVFESTVYPGVTEEIAGPVIETNSGYHIIQLIERSGDMINVRHILMKSKVSLSSLLEAKTELEKIEKIMNIGELSFEEVAKKYSDDISRNNGGLLINPQTGSSLFTVKQLPLNIRYVADRMKEGDISSISQFVMDDGRKAYRIIKMTQKTKEHIFEVF